MQVRVYSPRSDGSFRSEKVRLPRRRHLTKTLDRLELFLCLKCRRVVPFDYGCDDRHPRGNFGVMLVGSTMTGAENDRQTSGLH